MRLCLCWIFTAHLLLSSALLFSQPGRPSIGKEPSWISKDSIDYNNHSLDKGASDGYIDISFEKQVSLADQSEYCRRSKKIISQAGVQNASEISIAFDPSYEHLTFNSIRIIRKGQILNRLQLSNIKTVHQEKELSNFIYNGLLNAILILEDVREGDIIEYSYTIKGLNPIFENKFAETFSTGFSVPVYKIYYKIIVPASRKINIKNLNDTTRPTISSINGEQVYEWRENNIRPLITQDYIPSWYDPYAQILVSEYNSWKEVNDWAMKLFPGKIALSVPLQNKIKEIQNTHPTDIERTASALKFVQDDIRYMGIEMGENSHKPADPSKVFAQRFGDCKEKSYLLCCMLKAMNIDACPVLINTVYKKNINTLLPSPTDFDHVTVRVRLNGTYYWFDPTIAFQRGLVNNLFYPDYQAGLVISESTDALTSIAFRNTSYQHIKEYFKVPAMYGAATLVVTTTFQGTEADLVRNNFNNESITEIMNDYQKFYTKYYEDIKADSLTYVDDDSTGTFTTTEYYSIPEFWTYDKTLGNKFSFSAFIIDNILRKPKEKQRRMPFGLLFPAKYQEEVIVDLPHEWKVTENETHLQNACYSYNCRFFCAENLVYLEADYENYKDNATTAEAPAYFKDLSEYEASASYELSSGTDDVPAVNSHTSRNNILSTFLFLGVIAGGIVWWVRRK